MDKVELGTPDLTEQNIDKIAELFPQVITEAVGDDGELHKVVDFDALRQELTGELVEGSKERYQFTWPGKQEAKLEARRPINKALRPDRGDSVDFDTTENLYIEGDNLDALKLLRNTYAGKIKMIYIDPPYNTGHDFVYDDDFSISSTEYTESSGDFDESGGRLVSNLTSNGRFHSDWCSMMYPRLLLAKDLLIRGGIIFISIDDSEATNLRSICDEIYGESNFLASIVWQKRTSPDARINLGPAHDYIIAYTTNLETSKSLLNQLPLTEERASQYKNPDNDPRGNWASVDITGQTGHATQSQFYEITTPSGIKMKPPAGRCWALSESTLQQLVADNRIWFGENGESRPRQKKFLSETAGANAWTWWSNTEVGHNQEGAKEVKDLMGASDIFENPKPTRLLKRILKLATQENDSDILLDFFSGSGSLADAVMQQNAEDSGNRHFILVQLPEETPIGSAAKVAGFESIPAIGKERIRRAGAKIKENAGLLGQNLDIGFRVLKIDSSNFEDTYRTPENTNQASLATLAGNLKLDRSPEDLLFEVLPAFRIPLSAKIETTNIGGQQLFNVNDNQLLVCFDIAVTTEVVEEIAKLKPVYAVFRDASFANDSAAANFEELFKTYSPDTVRKVV